MNDFFSGFAFVTALAAGLGILSRWLKQPLLLGYVIAGALLAPLGLIDRIPTLEPLVGDMGKIGVVFLLFLVGLELSLDQIRSLGRVAIATGIGQIVFTSVVGFFLAVALGYSTTSSLYLAIALTFSSTIIIVKLLTEKGDLTSLYGKIAVGFLLVQDFVAVVILAVLSGFSDSGNHALTIAVVIVKVLLLLVGTVVVSRKIFPRIIPLIASSDEALFTASIAWCVAFAALVSSPLIGFSVEIGGFLAGLSLANISKTHQIAFRVRPLRDFFMILFFVSLGTEMSLGNFAATFVPGTIFSAFVLIGNPLIVLAIMGYLGYRRRTSFFTSLTVAQISEFSLILVAMGVRLGHVPKDILHVTTFVGVATMVISTYAILGSNKLYRRLREALAVFERKDPTAERGETEEVLRGHALLFGHNRAGRFILPVLQSLGLTYVVIDADPHVTEALRLKGVPCRAGDAADIEFLARAGVRNASLIVSTIDDPEDNESILSVLESVRHRTCIVIMTARTAYDARRLYDLGADYVLVSRFLGGEHIAHVLHQHELSREAVTAFASRHREIIYQLAT